MLAFLLLMHLLLLMLWLAWLHIEYLAATFTCRAEGNYHVGVLASWIIVVAPPAPL